MSGRPAAFLGLGAIGAPMAARTALDVLNVSRGRSFVSEALGESADYLEAIRPIESRAGVEIRG